MTTNPNQRKPREERRDSRMLDLVRKWRKEAYENRERGEPAVTEEVLRSFGYQSSDVQSRAGRGAPKRKAS